MTHSIPSSSSSPSTADHELTTAEMVELAARKSPQVIQWEHVTKMNDLVWSFWSGNRFCKEMDSRKNCTHQ
jgi:hypothetical protein